MFNIKYKIDSFFLNVFHEYLKRESLLLMAAYCAFGMRCYNPNCGYMHYNRLTQLNATLQDRCDTATFFDEVMTPDKLRLVNTSNQRGKCCKYSYLCYERLCEYRHPYNREYDLSVDCRIEFKRLLEKRIKERIKSEKQTFKNILDQEIKDMREGKTARVDWNDLLE